MNSAWLALGFLSRIPAPAVEFTPVTLSRALFWFPWVGALLGGSWWVSAVWLTPWCGSTMTAYALLLQGVLFTGALHLDGLADTFDGFSAAGGGKERALSAMKDSRIGAHGAVALGLVLLGKFVAFQSLTVAAAGTVCLTAAILPRFLSALTVAIARPARSDGLAVAFASEASGSAGKDDTSKPGLVFAGAGAIWLLIPVGVAGGESERWMILLGTSLVAMASTWLLLRRFSRMFGGVTGDTHGALIEVGETVILLTGAALGGR